MSAPSRVWLPTLVFEYAHDRIVATKLEADVCIKDPSDDLMFIGPRCEDWKEGPVWLDEDGNRVEEHRWWEPSDSGWMHYFNEKWTPEERRRVFVKYVMNYVYDESVAIGEETLRFDQDKITLDGKTIHAFDATWDTARKIEHYHTYVKGFLNKGD